jgi:hypothetical protein
MTGVSTSTPVTKSVAQDASSEATSDARYVALVNELI